MPDSVGSTENSSGGTGNDGDNHDAPPPNFSISGTDGQHPSLGLIQGSDGNLYGTTSDGGAYGGGTVFRITPAGEYTVLWSFGGNDTNGRAPNGLMQASDGNFYGMTEGGGTQNNGTVFRLTPSGTVTLMASFDPDNGGPARPKYNGPIQGRDGNLYGLTAGGGGSDLGSGTLFSMTLDGAVTKPATFDLSHGSEPIGSPIEASDGNFYGLTEYGDVNLGGNLFRVTPSGEMTSLHAFSRSGDDRRYPVGGLIEDADGNLYGMTCDFDGGSIVQVRRLPCTRFRARAPPPPAPRARSSRAPMGRCTG